MERGDSAPFFNRTCFDQCLNRHLSADDNLPFSTPENDFIFKRPPEAPTFYPTKEEFEDPILYISTIRPLAEQFGICKIVPPEGISFPFTLDVDNFKFATRVQYLCRIDAAAKNKAVFLGRLAKYWEMRGSPLHIPIVEHRVLDLYYLQRIVACEGGFDRVSEEERWRKVAERMNFMSFVDVAILLERSYRDILHPYMTFLEAERGNHSSSNPPTQKKSAAPNMKATEEDDVIFDKEFEESKEDFNIQLHRSKRIKFAENGPQASTSQQSEGMESQNEQGTVDRSNLKELEKLYSLTIGERPEKTYLKPETEFKFPENEFKVPETIFKVSKTVTKATETGSETPEPVFKVPFPVTEARQNVLARKSNELKRLQFSGAGPRIATFSEPSTDCKRKRESLSKKECCKCRKNNIDEILLDCTGCNDSYHLTCIAPDLNEIPRGKWHCAMCISKELQKAPVESMRPGFEDGKEIYDLKKFNSKADRFKRSFFGRMDGYPSKQMVENEFWRVMSQTALDCRVEYGADISGDSGTGFPTKENIVTFPPEIREKFKKFVDHPWNLNNLPVCNGSVFKYIDEPISGMKVPWMYVGMCFSTFCWHNEDHWSYSINYLHFGEAKTWYSVPGDRAEEFENAMKEIAPELFEVYPDILHQLSTMINPNVLMDKGIPVYRLDQEAGQFVITFPRAYHAGFNHGFNFAEAVNFAPPDWIEMGRRCVENYSLSKRACVFSQDELIFKIAASLDAADIRIAAAAYHDLYHTVHAEFEFREFVMGKWGADNKECEVNFEMLPDDERQCEFCQTTVFLSGVSCQCDPKKVVCIKHYDKLCSVCKPKDHYLKVKHSSEEFFEVFQTMLKVVSPYETWLKEVRRVLRSNNSSVHDQRGFIGIDYLKNLVKQAEKNRFPTTKLLKELIATVVEAETINDTSERIIPTISQPRLVIFGKAISVVDFDAWMYFVHYFEHCTDHRYHIICPMSVFRECICLNGLIGLMRDPEILPISADYPQTVTYQLPTFFTPERSSFDAPEMFTSDASESSIATFNCSTEIIASFTCSTEMPIIMIDAAASSTSEMPIFMDAPESSTSEMPIIMDAPESPTSEMPIIMDAPESPTSEMPIIMGAPESPTPVASESSIFVASSMSTSDGASRPANRRVVIVDAPPESPRSSPISPESPPPEPRSRDPSPESTPSRSSSPERRRVLIQDQSPEIRDPSPFPRDPWPRPFPSSGTVYYVTVPADFPAHGVVRGDGRSPEDYSSYFTIQTNLDRRN